MSLKTDLDREVRDFVDTEGVTIEDVQSVPREDRPVFTIAATIEWAKKPENADRIEVAAREVRAKARDTLQRIDDRVTATKNVMVDILMNDDTKEDFLNSFLGSIFGDD